MNPKQARSLRIQAAVLSVALALQYALGMYVNLYVSFPENATQGQLWEFAWSQKPLAAHIILAILILIGGVILLVRSLIYKSRKWSIASGIGLLAVLAAGASGATFIPSQLNLYSYSMAIAFIIAIIAYVAAVYSSDEFIG